MVDYSAGSASIKISPSFSGFLEKSRAELKAMDLTKDADILLRVQDAPEAQARLDAIARERVAQIQTRTAGVEETQARLAELSRTRTADIQARMDRASSGVARRDFGKLVDGLQSAGTVNLKVLGVLGASGAVADLLAVAGAAAKASQALGVLPAVGFAGLAGVGSVAVGLKGIPDTFKAINQQPPAGDQAEQQRERLDAVSEAEYRVSTATTGLSEAYKDADRSIRDMNLSLEEQKLNVADAAIAVDEAARNLAKVQHDPFADADTRKKAADDYQHALIRQSEAQNKLNDQSQDTAEANTKGVEGSKQVTSAQHELTSATEGLARAQAELNKAPGGGADKVAEAMAKLSPNAQQLVGDIRSLGPAWTDTRKAAQDALTAGLGQGIKDVAAVQLPALKSGIVGIDTAINSGLRGSLAALSTDSAKADFSHAMGNASVAFANAARAAGPLTDAVLKLVSVGSDFLPKFGQDVDDVAVRFDNLIKRTSADGSLKKWIGDGIESGKELARITEHLGSSIGSVFKAAGDNGETLKSLDDLTGRMSIFLKSTAGQDDMKRFFQESRAELDKLKPVLSDIPHLVEGVTGGFKAWADVSLPFLHAAADLLGAHPGLVRDAVAAYVGFKTVSPLLDLAKQGVNLANQSVGSFRDGLADTAGPKGVGKLASATGGLAGFLGGPWGVALGAGVAGLGLLTAAHDRASEAAEKQRQQLEALGQTLDKQTGRATQATIEKAAADLQKGGFLERAESLGVNTHDLTLAAAGADPNAKGRINDQLIAAILAQKGTAGGTWAGAGLTGLTDEEIAAALAGVPEAVKKYTDNAETAKTRAAQSGLQLGIPDLAQLKNALNDAGESAATLGGELNNTNSALGKMGEDARRTNEAIAGSFELTEQGRKAFADLGAAITAVPDAKTVVVQSLTADAEQKLKDTGNAIEHLPDGSVKVVVKDEDAKSEIQKIATQRYDAKIYVGWDVQSIDLDAAARKALNPGSGDNKTITGGNVGGRALGGEITGGIPGRDSVPSLLMPGEHVLTVADVDRLGGQSQVYALRRAIQRGELQQLRDTKARAAGLARFDIGGAAEDDDPNRRDELRPDPATGPAITPPPTTLYPQAPLPGRMSTEQIQRIQGRAAVDAANSDRNRVYNDPTSTPQDRQAADLKYLQAQNALESTGGQLPKQYTLPGIAASFAGALTEGVLDSLGLQGSILNGGYYGRDVELFAKWANKDNPNLSVLGGSYAYTPQNLPGIQAPAASSPGGTGGTGTNSTGSVNPDLGVIGSVSIPKTGGGGGQWHDLSIWALQRQRFNVGQVGLMEAQIQSESGGNPRAINNWDSNAKAGTPSKGLLQVIDPTFAAYRDKSLSTDIYDPQANVVAALNYYRARYGGDLSAQWGQGHGYADGGFITGPGGPRSDGIRAMVSPGEYVVNAFAAARHRPELEAINAGRFGQDQIKAIAASQWSPVRIAPDTFSQPTGGPQNVTHDRSIQITGPMHVMNNDELVRDLDRFQEQQSMGHLATY
ncbi:transglycosylase SLT domain-containing protein [Nocardia sp. alder85J]|uniref:transglycosylase SLT domain-containing protein n=1 Tax=Nocardia sp. alder85J TaxID=2862949 RepID=UPI002B1CC962|nr:transglycosylase SLT domain-containing protein [Nocardia sp. alder85J]